MFAQDDFRIAARRTRTALCRFGSLLALATLVTACGEIDESGDLVFNVRSR